MAARTIKAMPATRPQPARAVVLTISDSRTRGERPDLSGPAVAASLQSAGFLVEGPYLIADEQPQIESALRSVAEVTEPTLEWQMVRPIDEKLEVTVRVERGVGAGDDTETARKCVAALQERLGITTVIEVLDRETIPRSGYKAARVVDE